MMVRTEPEHLVNEPEPLSAIEKGRLFSAVAVCATCSPKGAVCTHGPRPQAVYDVVEKILSDRA